MTPELKAAWVSDLKSGKYPKTKGHLKDTTGYCCLGVLLETAGGGFTDKTWNKDVCFLPVKDMCYLPVNVSLTRSNELSEAGKEQFGLTHGQHDDLTHLNDESDTFAEVIDYIENNL